MIGLELIIEDRSIKAAVEDGVIALILSGRSDSITLSFTGLDNRTSRYSTWYLSDLKDGDSFDINILDIEAGEVSCSLEKRDAYEAMLVEYNIIKKKLVHKGLI